MTGLKAIMKYKVNIIWDAEQDLFEIYKYVFQNDSEGSAEKLYEQLYNKCLTLEKNPERGRIPPEMKLLGVDYFKEIICKPYRIIYQIIDRSVYIHCILDGRRDIQKLLMERLLRS